MSSESECDFRDFKDKLNQHFSKTNKSIFTCISYEDLLFDLFLRLHNHNSKQIMIIIYVMALTLKRNWKRKKKKQTQYISYYI